jgi:hypothetical protein
MLAKFVVFHGRLEYPWNTGRSGSKRSTNSTEVDQQREGTDHLGKFEEFG